MEQRIIKFKAKRLDGKGWAIGDLLHSYENGAIIVPIIGGGAFSVDPSTVCQFTGLKDKDDNPIWEHDIISIFDGRKPCEVIFEKGCFIAFNSTTGIRIPIMRGSDSYDWELHVVCNKFDRKEGEKNDEEKNI